MPRLRYRALTRAGAREAGVLDAPTPEAASASLRERGLIVIDVVADEARLSLSRIRHDDVAQLTRAIASLLQAGLPLVRALQLASEIAAPALGAALADVASRVERGASLAEALGAHTGTFPPSYVGLVRAGERAGALAEAMTRLADGLERDAQFRARILTAAIYPALLAIVGGAAVVVLLLVVLPRFAALFSASGSALPASTAMVLGISSFMRGHVGVLAGLSLLAVGILAWLAASRDAAHWRARLLLALPFTTSFYRELLAARAARLMSMLVSGGAPLTAALDDAAASLEVPHASEELRRLRARVREGARLAVALGEGSLFPVLFTRLVAVGEESSQLATFFTRAADLFEDRVRMRTARFLAIAEPALIVTFGLVVGAIALALVQAIYGINLTPLRTVR